MAKKPAKKKSTPKKAPEPKVEYTNKDFNDKVSELCLRVLVNSLKDIPSIRNKFKEEATAQLVKDFIIEQLDWAIPDVENEEFIKMRDSVIKKYTKLLEKEGTVSLKKID